MYACTHSATVDIPIVELAFLLGVPLLVLGQCFSGCWSSLVRHTVLRVAGQTDSGAICTIVLFGHRTIFSFLFCFFSSSGYASDNDVGFSSFVQSRILDFVFRQIHSRLLIRLLIRIHSHSFAFLRVFAFLSFGTTVIQSVFTQSVSPNRSLSSPVS